ncbi:Clp protease N-terminal domain-containing protein [Actinomadura nitritigenes]|uniref:Clp protease N-terminal domain-containing protein n=1 Tax=Actinomadura nitritigenes TaxID=134602 RepID=UPI003D8CCDA1
MGTRITGEGRQIAIAAQQQARRLGHPFIGCEHLLYGVACTDAQVGAVLRERGVTPQRYEAEFLRLVKQDSAQDPFDEEALRAIGIDLEAVRTRIDAAFGPEALGDAASSLTRRRHGRRSLHYRLRRRRSSGRNVTGHLPLTRRARKCLTRSLSKAQAPVTGRLAAQHIAVQLLDANAVLPQRILAAIGTSAPDLREEILRRQHP